MSERRIGCSYCFRTLDPEDKKKTLRTFVKCSRCGTIYHTRCWQTTNYCLTCDYDQVETIQISPPSPLRIVTKTRAMPLKSALQSRHTKPTTSSATFQFGKIWLRETVPSTGIGLVSGLGLALSISMAIDNYSYSGGIVGVLAGIVLAVIFGFIALAIFEEYPCIGCFVVVVGVIAVWFGGMYVFNKISVLLRSYSIVYAWLYMIFGTLGLFFGLGVGNFKALKKLNRLTLAVISSGTLILVPLVLMIVSGALSLSFGH